MIKVIRRPLTNVNNIDIATGMYVESEMIEQEINLKGKIDKWLCEKKQEAREDGRVHIEGLGWVML